MGNRVTYETGFSGIVNRRTAQTRITNKDNNNNNNSKQLINNRDLHNCIGQYFYTITI